MFSPTCVSSLARALPGSKQGVHATVVATSACMTQAAKDHEFLQNDKVIWIQAKQVLNGVAVTVPVDESMDYRYDLKGLTSKDWRIVCIVDGVDRVLVGRACKRRSTLRLSSIPRMAMMIGPKNRRREWVSRSLPTKKAVRQWGMNDTLVCPQFTPHAGYMDEDNSQSFFATWEDKRDLVRYAGWADIDLGENMLQSIIQGKQALVRGQTPCCYVDTADKTAREQVKATLKEFYDTMAIQNPQMTVQELLSELPFVQQMATASIELAKATGGIAVFTGNKGFHVYWKDENLFFRWLVEERGDLPLHTYMLQYFKDIGLSEETRRVFDDCYDIAPHRHNAGFAIRGFTPRKSTNVWPTLVYPDLQNATTVGMNSSVFQTDSYTGCKVQQGMIIDFVRWMREKCPTPDAPGVRTLRCDVKRGTKRKKKNGASKVTKKNTAALLGDTMQGSHRDVQAHRHFETTFAAQCVDDNDAQTRLCVQREYCRSHSYKLSLAAMNQAIEWMIRCHLAQIAATDKATHAVLDCHEHFAVRGVRFVLDIDGYTLGDRDFKGLYDAMDGLCNGIVEEMVVCATTSSASAGRKWHIVFPEIVVDGKDDGQRLVLLSEGLARRLRKQAGKETLWCKTPDILTGDNALIDTGPFKNGTLRMPFARKVGAEKGVYVPVQWWNKGKKTKQLEAEQWTDKVKMHRLLECEGTDAVVALARSAYATPLVPDVTHIARLEAAVQKKRAKQESDALQAMQTCERTFSPRRRVIEIPGSLAFMSKEFVVEAVMGYLNHRATLCTAAEFASFNVGSFAVRFMEPHSARVEVCDRDWQLCQVYGGRHTGTSRVCYNVYRDNAGRIQVMQWCVSGKCSGLSAKERNLRAPSIQVVHLCAGA